MKTVKKINLGAMSTDDMWQLHTEIGRYLSIRLRSEKRELEKRLTQLGREGEVPQAEKPVIGQNVPRQRRTYPQVLPKYQNPNDPLETWSGRGKQPRWLAAALKRGHVIEDFIISDVEPHKTRQRRAAAI